MVDKPDQKIEPAKSDAEENASKFAPAQSASDTFAAQVLQIMDRKGGTGGNGTFENNQGPRPNDTALKLNELIITADGLGPDKAVEKNKVESFESGKGVVRALDKGVAQHVAGDGTTTTHLSANLSLEYDPKTQKYTSIDAKGTRTEIPEADYDKPLEAGGKSLNQLRADGFPQAVTENGVQGEKRTFPDGRVETSFDKGPVEKRTNYPPGYRSDDAEAAPADGLRQVEQFRAKDSGDTTANCARTARTYEDRKETEFSAGDIKKITAFKDTTGNNPAVLTEYQSDGQGKFKGPEGAKSVATYKEGNPEGIETVTSFANGADRVKYRNGVVSEQPGEGGTLSSPVGSGERAGILDVNAKSGMPSHMKIGDRDFQMGYDTNGKPNRMTVEVKGDKPGRLEYNPQTGEIKGTGAFAPHKDGKIQLEGMTVQTKDGKIVGSISLNKAGDLRYQDGDGPERKETVRRADGTKEEYDFKTWKQTVTGLDGQQSTAYWNGFEWDKTGKPSQDGKKIEFTPSDPNKPTSIERTTGGTPPQDITKIGYKNGTVTECDWKNGVQIERSKNPDKETTRYFDGATYREGEKIDPKSQDGLRLKLSDTDKAIKFKDNAEPRAAIRHNDGSVSLLHSNARVEKNEKNQVTSVQGPNGNFKFEYDSDGDLNKRIQTDELGKVIGVISRNGKEEDAGMQHWMERAGNGQPHPPGDKPPRDPNKPNGYNSWVDADGKPAKDLDGKPFGQMNLHVAADGTSVIERKPEQAGAAPEKIVMPPGAGRSRETATGIEKQLPGGVTEFTDKTKTPPSTEVKFTRNGIEHTVKSSDGPYQVSPDGTVSQTIDGKDSEGKPIKKTSYNFPDGSLASSTTDSTGKQSFTELKIASPGKTEDQYESFKPGSNQVKSLEYDVASGGFKVTNEDNSTSILDVNNRRRVDKKPDENFTRVSSLDSGKLLGLVDNDKNVILRIDDKDGSALGIGGKTFKADEWDLSKIEKNAEGKPVLKAKNGTDSAVIGATSIVERKGSKEFTTVVNPDGSSDMTEKGTSDVYHRDRANNLLPTDAQANAITPSLTALLDAPTDAAKLAEFKKELNRFNLSADPLKDAQTFFKALGDKMGATISVQPNGPGKFNLTVIKNGKTVVVPWAKA